MFTIHNDREKILIKYLYEECVLCSVIFDFNVEINKINGILSSLYMLNIIEEAIIIKNYFGVIELKESIKNIKEKNHERKWYPCTNW